MTKQRDDIGKAIPRSGSLLIAQPWLHEPVFSRAVILLMDTEQENDEKGSMGLVMNHPSALKLTTLIPELTEADKIPIYVGGPVDLERLFLIHSLPEHFPGSIEILPGLFLGGTLEEIHYFLREFGADMDNVNRKMRFIIGYSGWSNGQLSAEIAEHTWAVGNRAKAAELMNGFGTDYWRREVSKLGPDYRAWLVVPEIAELN